MKDILNEYFKAYSISIIIFIICFTIHLHATIEASPRNKLENKNLQQISAAISARSAIFQKRLKKEHYCKRLKSSALKGNYASFSRLYKKNKCNDKKLFWHLCYLSINLKSKCQKPAVKNQILKIDSKNFHLVSINLYKIK